MFQTIDFRTPNILFGMNQSEQAGAQARRLGAKRVLLITGPTVQKAGLAEKALASLKAEKLKVEVNVQGRDTPEPATEVAEEAAAVARDMKADVIIGIGGGSILDVSKMAAALQKNPGKVRDYFGKEKVPNKGIPTIIIPTTSGTGAEVTKHAIFLDRETRVKKAVASGNLLPDVAIIDPMLTVSCPPKVTAASGLDALYHAAEPFVSKMANPVTDAISLEAISIITRWLGPAFADGSDLEARYHMSLGSLMAGLVLNNAGTSLVHALAYPIGGEFHMTHGVSLSVLVLPCYEYIMVARQQKFVQLAAAMGEEVEGLSEREAARLALDALRHLIRSVDIPTSLTEAGITDRSRVDQWAIDGHAEQRLLSRCVRQLTVEDCKIIYNNAF